MKSDTQPIRVLHYDDDVDDRLLFALNMEDYGFVVHSAQSPEETLQYASLESPDVIVLDIMQYTDLDAGIRLCAELRSPPIESKATIVMLSNRDDEAVELKSRSAGADGYVVKGSSEECARVINALVAAK